jgi:hypothetical protein
MANSAKVIFNIEERRKNTGPLDRSPDLASLSRTSSSHPLPAASESVAVLSCESIREEVVRSRPLITNSTVSYARLSLIAPRAEDYDGDTYRRMGINIDLSYNNNPKFQRYKWRLTNKRSEFYANLPDDWTEDWAYSNAWAHYNTLTTDRWIGKACYRNAKGSKSKLKLVPLTAMVLWHQDDAMHYRLWIESAEITGRFNLDSKSKYYVAASEPVKNFQPTTWAIIEL